MMNMKASIFHTSRHLTSREVTDATACCPICLYKGQREAVAPLQQHPAIVLLRCPRCRGISASYMPAAEILRRYYAEYYREGDERHTFHQIEKLVAHITGLFDLPIIDVVRILDFGGGDGELGRGIAEHMLRQRAAQRAIVTVVDFHQTGMAGSGNITIEHYRELSGVTELQTLILASAVLEHIPDLHGTLTVLNGMIEPGGYFYARTPYMTPFRRVLKSFDLTYPAHVHDLGPSFWNRFVETFTLDARMLFSQPSPVETSFARAPFRTAISHLCKTVAGLELALSPRKRDYCWEWVGGWEVLMRMGIE